MLREMFKSKIHRATITYADLNYEGSITIDENLLEAADILVGEKVQVVNINNGQRLETYTIGGKRGSGVVGLNGAAARLGAVGDRIIVITYCSLNDDEIKSYKPRAVLVNEKNEIVRKLY